jgi:ribosome biogenesis GTPase
MARHRPKPIVHKGRPGRVIETRGRRVLVRDEDGERVCFLSGQRAVVGDRVRWVEVQGQGGKLVAVDERDTVLRRVDFRGREQVLAANLSGLLVVATVDQPAFQPGLLDRYLVAAASADLSVLVLLNKSDLPTPDGVDAAVALREAAGVPFMRVSAHSEQGLDDLRAWMDARAADGPWALVGHSGVGKTSLAAALLPQMDVGAVGPLSSYWGTGQHTTTGTRLLPLGKAEIVDSPGIRTFAPAGLSAADVGRHFPGLEQVVCGYRDCLHRPEEDRCVAEAILDPDLLKSYRRLVGELLDIEERMRP